MAETLIIGVLSGSLSQWIWKLITRRLFLFGGSNKRRVLICARKTSHEDNTDLNRLQQLLPGMRVNTRYTQTPPKVPALWMKSGTDWWPASLTREWTEKASWQPLGPHLFVSSWVCLLLTPVPSELVDLVINWFFNVQSFALVKPGRTALRRRGGGRRGRRSGEKRPRRNVL